MPMAKAARATLVRALAAFWALLISIGLEFAEVDRQWRWYDLEGFGGEERE